MKTKIIPFDTKIIPFDLETAKKIQAGEIEGKIKTRDGQDVCIVLWDKKDEDGYVILALIDKPGTDHVLSYTRNGEIFKGHKSELDLVLEVPDNEPQFKPFDKVLVRENDGQVWHCDFYSYTDRIHGVHYCVGHYGEQILPYEANEHLVGTTDKPKEE